jgi:DNA-binding transcriptional regulator YdaS (Cro superfamily)
MTEDEVREEARLACQIKGSQTAFADEIGVSVPYLNDFLKGRRQPGPSILRALGLVKVVTYERKNGSRDA